MSDPIVVPRILLTNDDGIDAEGLKVLREVAQDFAEEVWVFAPVEDRSAVGPALTITRPLTCAAREERVWAVDGTPADCVVLALSHFMADEKPSLVLTGVNAGANLGDESDFSGTVGAALMAMRLGVPAIAFSQKGGQRNSAVFRTARTLLPEILGHLLAEGWRKDTCLSVNFPELPPEEVKGLSWARQNQKTISNIRADRRINPRKKDYFWLSIERHAEAPGTANSDSAILNRGEISVSMLGTDRSLEITRPSLVFEDAQATRRAASRQLVTRRE